MKIDVKVPQIVTSRQSVEMLPPGRWRDRVFHRPDETDDGGAIRDDVKHKATGLDYGFRPDDVDLRGLPPLKRDNPDDRENER